MFDMRRIGKIISQKRKALDLTQMELADRMGVSFQAVSNWERGGSMPDVEKLPQLARTLELSVDELLGDDGGARLVKQVMQTPPRELDLEQVTQEDLADAAPLLPPRQAKRIAEDVEKRKGPLNIGAIASLAPFLDEETLDGIVDRALGEGCGLGSLASIAPFLSQKTLDRLALGCNGNSMGELASIAPFVSEQTMDALAEQRPVGELSRLASIAPFVSEEALGRIALRAAREGSAGGELASIAPFLDQGTLKSIIELFLSSGGGEAVGALACFLER